MFTRRHKRPPSGKAQGVSAPAEWILVVIKCPLAGTSCGMTLDSGLSECFSSVGLSSSFSFALPVSTSNAVGCSTFLFPASEFDFGLIPTGGSGFLSPAGIEIFGLDMIVSKPAWPEFGSSELEKVDLIPKRSSSSDPKSDSNGEKSDGTLLGPGKVGLYIEGVAIESVPRVGPLVRLDPFVELGCGSCESSLS